MPSTQEIEADKKFLGSVFAEAGVYGVEFKAIRQNHGEDLDFGILPENILTLDPSRPITFEEQGRILDRWRRRAQESYNHLLGRQTHPSLGEGRLLFIWENEPDGEDTWDISDQPAHPIFLYEEREGLIP